MKPCYFDNKNKTDFFPVDAVDNNPDNGLKPNRRQAITWTNVDPVECCINVSPASMS